MFIRSSIHAHVLAGLLALVPGLLCCTPGSAQARGSALPKATEVVRVEIDDGEGDGRAFVVPVDGELAGWTELAGQRQFCRFQAQTMSDERLHLDLRCYTEVDRTRKMNLEVATQRALTRGERTLIAELESAEGSQLRVLATRS